MTSKFRGGLRSSCIMSCIMGTVWACTPEKPPGADEIAAQKAASRKPARPEGANKSEAHESFQPAAQEAILTFAGERGKFSDTPNVEDVPEVARGMVRVHLLEGPRAPAGTVWVTNLGKPSADEPVTYVLETVPRELFEELALGMGRKSKVELPGDLEVPEALGVDQNIVVYKTDWCGVCKKLTAYLDRKGVVYETKDIEKDRSAASELAAKAKKHGVPMGSVPMMSIAGELLVGFDRNRIEQLLAQKGG